MGTKTVRLFEEDVERVSELSGLAPGASFALKAREVVERAGGRRGVTREDVRAVVPQNTRQRVQGATESPVRSAREELERFRGRC